MAERTGRRSKPGGSKSFQITLSSFAYAYLGYLARTTNMGDGSENGCRRIYPWQGTERMRLSGDYLKEVFPPEPDVDGSPRGEAGQREA
jgi:hypothetical protein